MTADTQAQGDLIALAVSCGFLPWPEQGDTEARWVVLGSQLEAFAAALQGRGTQEGEPSEWQPVATRPKESETTYLVANAAGQVAPWIRGVIHNNTGTEYDWNYGENITHWRPLPAAPRAALAQAQAGERTC